MPDSHLLLLRRDAGGTDVVLDRVVDRTANELNRALQTNHTVGSPLQRTTRSPVEAHRGSCGHHRVVLERRELVGRDVLVFLSLERAAKVLRLGRALDLGAKAHLSQAAQWKGRFQWLC